MLAFRELPLFLGALQKLTLRPDVFVFDGNGVLHERMMGVATHASLFVGRPTIGVAKTFYSVEKARFAMPGSGAGAATPIVVGGACLGTALRSRENVKPIFVSPGNYIDLETAVRLVLSLVTAESRLPVPTRLADLATHRLRRSLRE